MLWVDKHRPTRLEDLSYHDEITERLASLAANPASLPHLFVYGPSGSGKRTRINALLTALFGPSSQRLKLDKRNFTTPSGKSVDIHMITSPHHVELSPGDAGNNDRFVIQDVLKEMASTKNVRSVTNMVTETTDSSNANANANANAASEMKIVVLTQVDRMSKQAQAALRRTMEKYASTCRLILCCNSPSKLIAPLQSRCLGVRVAAPSIDQVSKSWYRMGRLAFHPRLDSFHSTLLTFHITYHPFLHFSIIDLHSLANRRQKGKDYHPGCPRSPYRSRIPTQSPQGSIDARSRPCPIVR